MTGEVTQLHGFNVRDDGKNTVKRLNPGLRAAGFDIREFNYGWVGRLGVRMFTDRFARLLAGMVTPGSYAVGHSNGCHIIHRSLRDHAAPFSRVVYIAPALDADTPLPPQAEQCLVLYSETDKATRVAEWIPFSGWGGMGHKGYTGEPDRRIVSVPIESLLGDGFDPVGHSGYFRPAIVRIVADAVAAFFLRGQIPDDEIHGGEDE